MNKKKKNKNKTNSKLYELHHILDPKYFHISAEIKSNDEIEWFVYYKNLPTNLYFSHKNKALLTSRKNTIEDIYKLKRKFESEKQIEIFKNTKEYVYLSKDIFKHTQQIKTKFWQTITDLLLINLIFAFIDLIFIQDLKFGLLNLIYSGFLVIFGILRSESIDKISNKCNKEFEEKFFMNKIRQQGLFFAERLRQ